MRLTHTVLVAVLLVHPLIGCGERDLPVSVRDINRDQEVLQQILDATNFRQYVSPTVLKTIPLGKDTDVELTLFRLNYEPTPSELAAEYKRRGLVADPVALAKYVAENPSSVDESPLVCQWDFLPDGQAYYIAFSRWRGEREVQVGSIVARWLRDNRFVGVSK